MTDITELAQREKFEAWFVNDVVGADVNFPAFKDGEYAEGEIYDEQLYFMLQAMWMAWKAANAELVEALEKAQRYIEELREWNAGLAQESFERQQRIVELQQGCENDPRTHEIIDLQERITELEDAEKKICAANVTLDARAELAERQLESRTVKLPVGYTASSGHPFNEAERTVMIPGGGDWLNRFDVEHVLTAAGIKWEAE